MRWLIFSLSLVTGLGACAGNPGWSNPQLPPERKFADLAQCRRDAEETLGPTAAVDPGPFARRDPMELVDRTRTLDQFDDLVGACMSGKGYRQGP